jgi:hypothetical protein
VGFSDKAKPSMKLGPSDAAGLPGALSFPVAVVKRERDRKCKRVGRSHLGYFIFPCKIKQLKDTLRTYERRYQSSHIRVQRVICSFMTRVIQRGHSKATTIEDLKTDFANVSNKRTSPLRGLKRNH